MTHALEAEAIEVRRADASLVLVEQVSLAIDAGRIVGVVGETGAGKTLTMRALLGLLPPGVQAHGRLRLGGETWIDAGVEARQRPGEVTTSVVFQQPRAMFDPMARVGDQLVEEALLRRLMDEPAARERARHLLGELGLHEPATTMELYPHQLSGGMIQRAAIAMALMTRPAVLFVDEPTSALDAHVRHEVLGLIRRLAAEEGTATFLISHDLFSVSRYCDAIVVMYGGRVVERGPTATVLERPQHPYTAALLRCSPTTRGTHRERLPVIAGAPPAPGRWPSGCVFHPRCPLAFECCPVERPALRTVGEHGAACHLAFEGESE